jgi:hypothetical protein
VHRARNLYAKLPERERERERERVKRAYWQALDDAISAKDAKHRRSLTSSTRAASGGGEVPGRRSGRARRASALPDPAPPPVAKHG